MQIQIQSQNSVNFSVREGFKKKILKFKFKLSNFPHWRGGGGKTGQFYKFLKFLNLPAWPSNYHKMTLSDLKWPQVPVSTVVVPSPLK